MGSITENMTRKNNFDIEAFKVKFVLLLKKTQNKMTIKITLKCFKYDGEDIRKNEINKMNKQNYQCKTC